MQYVDQFIQTATLGYMNHDKMVRNIPARILTFGAFVLQDSVTKDSLSIFTKK